jgi:chemotaxis protein histidine kinase CheA
MAFDQSKFLARFVEEAREHCSRINQGLIDLESAPGDAEMLNALFRSAHTIKGSSRMMKLTGVTELAHHMEDVLDAVRGGKMTLAPSVSDTLFRGVDALSALLEKIAGGDAAPAAPEALCKELAQAVAAAPAPGAEAAETPAAPAAPSASAAPAVNTAQSGAQSPPAAAAAEVPVPAASSASADRPPLESAAPAASAKTAAEEHGPAAAPAKGKPADYLRIHAGKLDDLVRLMGEIVSEHGRSRRQIGRLREMERAVARHLTAVAGQLQGADKKEEALVEAGALLQLSLRQAVRDMHDASLMQDHLVGDLQETSLKLRMQPLSTVFDPLRRTVRDLAHEHGKDIDFMVEGGDTELDRKIIDRIGDSLIHMIRNSLDHGLESPEERVAAGKPAKGTITLSAFYDSGCVTLSLSDNGRGLSLEKLRDKALSKRLFDADTLAGMSRAEVIDLIFMPGFSTSPIITDLSGRGVGMDVVRKSIVDELKGTIIIESKEGSGTTFLMRLPLNLAVFPLFLLLAGDKTCALPATSIAEMISVPRSEIIEIVNKRAIRLREQIIPVESLATILKLPASSAPETDDVMVVIVRDGEEKLGLLVDDIVSREEMVVKPLPLHLQKLRMVSGATIGERNSIVNVLHVPEILRQARELGQSGRRVQQPKEAHASTVLVVDDSLNTREIEKSILEAYGYKVVTAEDGQEALEMTRDTLYDLVITDVEMPRLDGFSLTERLRADERYGAVPIIIVTSREKDEDKKRGILVGANAYIVKGAFDQSNLLETVRSLIG